MKGLALLSKQHKAIEKLHVGQWWLWMALQRKSWKMCIGAGVVL